MRKIGEIKQREQASAFSDYLFAQDIDNTLEPLETGEYEIWVHDETSLPLAREALNAFLKDPANTRYTEASSAAETKRRAQKRQQTASERNLHDRQRVLRGGIFRGTPLTRLLIILSILATVFGGLGTNTRITQWLSITEYTTSQNGLVFDSSLPEISQGQVWRLLTPVFLHAALTGGFGFLHLLFNMLWLRDLGGMIENAQGSVNLLHKLVVIGLLSNLLQFVVAGPAFGGMSGVVFGLLGYIWMRGRYDLTSGLYVHSQTVMMMMFWFFLCLTDAMGPVANAAHAGGLVTGIAWGWLAARRVNTRS